MNDDLISVILPIYNVEKYLKRCLLSVCNQTYKNLEIILVNDGSKDDSLSICKYFKEKDKRIYIIDKKNSGLASARNKGLEIAKGKYISFIDSDDWIEPDMIEHLYKLMVGFGADLSVCGFFIDKSLDVLPDNKKILKKEKYSIQEMDQEKAMKYAISPNYYYGFAWNKFYKRSVIGEMRYDETIFKGEDSPFTCEYILKCKKVIYDPTPKYHYVQSDISITRSKFSNKKMTVLDSYQGVIDYAKKVSDDAKRMAEEQYANHVLSLLVNIINTNEIEFSDEVKYLKKELKRYKKEYMQSTEINIQHKIAYYLATYCFIIFRIMTKMILKFT